MKILLTGASGYLGSGIAQELMAKGHHVFGIARDKEGLQGLADRFRGFTPLLHDLEEPIALSDSDFDLVIHAAGANDVISRDPRRALTLTTLTTQRALDFCVRQVCPRFIYISTFQVYGAERGLIDESSPCLPKNHYALTHFFAEQWCEMYARSSQLSWLAVRPVNIYGLPAINSMSRWTLVPGCFCKMAVEEHEIVLQTSGSQHRDFISLDEISRQIGNIAINFHSIKSGPLNLSSGASVAISDIARLVKDRFQLLTGVACKLRFLTSEGSPVSTSVDPGEGLFVESRFIPASDIHRSILKHDRLRDMQNYIDKVILLLRG
jgi:UDP-glucose 4-epimerase